MDDHVHAEVQRLDVVRRRQRGVDDRHDLARFGHLDDSRDIEHAQVGVRGRFGEDDVRRGLDGLFDGLGRGVHDRVLDAELAQEVGGEVARLAVAVAGKDDVAARLHEGHDHQEHGGHARGVEHRAFGAFDGRELALRFLLRGVAVAGVLVLADQLALALGPHEFLDLVGGVEIIVGRMHDGRGHGIMRMGNAAPAVDGQGGRVPFARV